MWRVPSVVGILVCTVLLHDQPRVVHREGLPAWRVLAVWYQFVGCSIQTPVSSKLCTMLKILHAYFYVIFSSNLYLEQFWVSKLLSFFLFCKSYKHVFVEAWSLAHNCKKKKISRSFQMLLKVAHQWHRKKKIQLNCLKAFTSISVFITRKWVIGIHFFPRYLCYMQVARGEPCSVFVTDHYVP